MTSSREALLAQLADAAWHAAEELAPTVSEHGLAAWIRLLRLSGYVVDERLREGALEYRLVLPEPS